MTFDNDPETAEVYKEWAAEYEKLVERDEHFRQILADEGVDFYPQNEMEIRVRSRL